MNPSTVLVSVEEYLHTSYDPDCDYVEGVIEERNVGEKDHSRLQGKLFAFFYGLGEPFHAWPELRVQVKPDRFRVPDVCVTIGEPEGRIVTEPPLVVIEIVSTEDPLGRMITRLRDYEAFGVPHIWLIDPWNRQAYVFRQGSLIAAPDQLEVSGDAPVVVSTAWLFGPEK